MDSLLAHLSSLSADSVYLTLIGILLLCGLGMPIPEDISLISAGYLAHLGVVPVNRVFAVCLLAVLAGDAMAFGLGWKWGHRLLKTRFLRRHFNERKQRRVKAYFRKFGSKVIFVARFLPGLRFSIFFSAGTLGVRPAVFLIYDSLAAIVSVPALVYFAWYFGEHIDKVVRWSRRSEYGILAIAVAVAIFVLVKIMRSRKTRKTTLASSAVSSAVSAPVSSPVPPADPPAAEPGSREP